MSSGRDTEVSKPSWLKPPQDTEVDNTSDMDFETYREWVLSARPGSPIDKSP